MKEKEQRLEVLCLVRFAGQRKQPRTPLCGEDLTDSPPFCLLQLFELANFLAENFVFLYIGVSVFTLQPLRWHAGFILSSFVSFLSHQLRHPLGGLSLVVMMCHSLYAKLCVLVTLCGNRVTVRDAGTIIMLTLNSRASGQKGGGPCFVKS